MRRRTLNVSLSRKTIVKTLNTHMSKNATTCKPLSALQCCASRILYATSIFFSLILSLVVLECLAVHKNYNARQTGCLEDANRTPPQKYFFFYFCICKPFFSCLSEYIFFLNIVHKKIADDTTERLVCEPKRCIWPDVSPVGISSFVWARLFSPIKATFLMKSALLWPISWEGATQMPEGQLPREGKNTTEQNGAAI